MEKEQEYVELLKILIAVAEANKSLAAEADDRILDAEGLLLKFFSHASSGLYLYRSTNLKEIKASFFDHASINVLGRVALETLYIFHYVFTSPSSEEEKDFRYLSWLYSGLLERQHFSVCSPQGKKQLEHERGLIQSLKGKIENNLHFKKLAPKKQKKLLEKGKWRLESWTAIALSLGLNDSHAKEFYSYLCGYAHASNLSVLQVRQANTAKSQQALCAATMGVLIIAMANMIKEYCKLFEKSSDVLNRNVEMARLVNFWIDIGASSSDEIEIDWEKANA